MTIGADLRRWRRDADLTLADVASKLELSVVHVSQIERGAKNPPAADALRTWLKFLGKEETFENMLLRSTRERKSLKISLTGRSERVVDMAGSLARQVEGGEIDDSTADEIFKILNRRNVDEGSSQS